MTGKLLCTWLHFRVVKLNQNHYIQIELKYLLFIGHDKVVQLLIDHGSNVSATDDDGDTPLHLAADWGDGFNTKQTKNQVNFKQICILGHDKVVELLLEHGSNVSAINTDGYTPLHWAARLGKKIKSKPSRNQKN